MEMVAIRWIDSQGGGHWDQTVNLKDKDFEPMECFSVGYVFRENDEYLCLVPTIANEGGSNEQIMARLSIPKCAIQSRETLTKKESES